MRDISRAPVSLLLCATLLAGCWSKSEQDLIASGKALSDKGDLSAALIEYKNALQKNPSSAEARFLMGRALYGKGEYAGAIIELQKAQDLKYPADELIPLQAKASLEVLPPGRVIEIYGDKSLDQPEAMAALRSTLARAQAREGNTDKAQALLQAVVKDYPQHSAALLVQARMNSPESPQASLDTIEQVLSREPRNIEALMLKADIKLLTLRDIPGATQGYQQALAAQSNHLLARSALFSIAMLQKDYKAAREQVEQLKKSHPGNPQTRFLQAQLAYQEGDLKSAKETVLQLLSRGGETPRVLQLAGAIEAQNGSLLQAETYLTKALQLGPDLIEGRRQLAQVQLRTGQPQKALATLKPVLEGGKPDAGMLSLAAQAHLQNGDGKASEALFKEASRVDPSDNKVRTALALSRLSKGETAEALDELRNIASADKDTSADVALISAQLARQQFDQALSSVDALEKKIPDKPLPEEMRGRIQLLRKDEAAARKSFERALERDPKYFPAAAALASLELQRGELPAALKRYERLLEADPSNLRAMLAVAELRAQTGAPKEQVRQLLDQAIKLNPAEPGPRLLLVAHLLANKDVKAAIDAAQSANAAIPGNGDILDALGRAQMESGDYNQAINTFSKQALLQPKSPQPLVRMADAQILNRQLEASIQSLRKALEVSPDLLIAQKNLIALLRQTKKHSAALDLTRSYQQRHPKDPLGFAHEGDIQFELKRWDLAANAYREGIKRGGSDVLVTRLHTTLLRADKKAEADRFIDTWLAEHPKNTTILTYLGDAAALSGNYAVAEARYKEVLALQPKDSLAMNNLANVLLRQGKPGAAKLAEQAAALSPSSPAVLDTWATALAAENNLPKALEQARKAHEMAPDTPVFELTLARILIKSGDKTQARQHLEKLRNLGDAFGAEQEVQQLLKQL